MNHPVKIGLFFTHNAGALSAVTSASTISMKELFKGKFNDLATHTGPYFEYSDGKREYFEALMDKGWTGPEPLAKVVEWAAANPKRRLRLYDMTAACGYTVVDVARRYEMANQRKSVWKYSKAQLGLHLRISRFVRGLFGRSLFKPTTDVVICSEAASQFVDNPPDLAILRACGVQDFDLIDPAMLERIAAKYGTLCVL